MRLDYSPPLRYPPSGAPRVAAGGETGAQAERGGNVALREEDLEQVPILQHTHPPWPVLQNLAGPADVHQRVGAGAGP